MQVCCSGLKLFVSTAFEVFTKVQVGGSWLDSVVRFSLFRFAKRTELLSEIYFETIINRAVVSARGRSERRAVSDRARNSAAC